MTKVRDNRAARAKTKIFLFFILFLFII